LPDAIAAVPAPSCWCKIAVRSDSNEKENPWPENLRASPS
jgi:hypothetical protein